MNELGQRELDLLHDVARLLRKHGPGAFEELAQSLRDPQALQNVLAVLEASARIARSTSRSAAKKRRSFSQPELPHEHVQGTLQDWTEVILGKPPETAD